MAHMGRRQSIAVLPSFTENAIKRLDDPQKPEQQKQVVGRRPSLTFEEWSQKVETREKLKQSRIEKERQEEEERDMMLSEQKFKRRMSFQQWKEAKTKPADETIAEIEPTSEEENDHQEKSDRAFQKWLLQKEKQKLKNEQRLLEEARIRRKKLEEKLQAVAEKNTHPRLGRRASII